MDCNFWTCLLLKREWEKEISRWSLSKFSHSTSASSADDWSWCFDLWRMPLSVKFSSTRWVASLPLAVIFFIWHPAREKTHCLRLFTARPFGKCSLIMPRLGEIISGRSNSASVPFNSPGLSIIAPRSIPRNGGVIFRQLSCHILENVNEHVCKIKFMGCQWRIRTRRAITYLLSSFKLWYIMQKTPALNAGISIVRDSEVSGPKLQLCLVFFVWKSNEMKMCIICRSAKKLMRGWGPYPDFILFLAAFVISSHSSACSRLKCNFVLHTFSCSR